MNRSGRTRTSSARNGDLVLARRLGSVHRRRRDVGCVLAKPFDGYLAANEEKLKQLNDMNSPLETPGEIFCVGMGRSIYQAMIDFLRAHRHEVEQRSPEAAE